MFINDAGPVGRYPNLCTLVSFLMMGFDPNISVILWLGLHKSITPHVCNVSCINYYTPLRSTLFSACRPSLKYSVRFSAGVAQTEKDHPFPSEDYVFIWDY